MTGKAPARGGSGPAPDPAPEPEPGVPDAPDDGTPGVPPTDRAGADAPAAAAENDPSDAAAAEEPAPDRAAEHAVRAVRAVQTGHALEAEPDGRDAAEAAEGASGPSGDHRTAAAPHGATAPAVTGGSTETPLTHDFPPPEGAGRAASGDAPAPARQWPLISVLSLAALGLLTVGVHPFDAAFRVGTIMVGAALMGGGVLRRLVPSVGMLAVRSRFTDMVTYGVLGVAIVLFALMIQPRPWVDIPFLQSVVHSSVP